MIRIIQGHVLNALKSLPDNSVHCVITSPPYFSVRAFHGEPQIWGGDPNCAHDFQLEHRATETHTLAYRPDQKVTEQHGLCLSCGAWRGSLGAEPTTTLFVKNLCTVFKEVFRVLHPSGTLWMNLGDRRTTQSDKGLKPKDLMGIPWRAAFALQEEGWYLRSTVILQRVAPIWEAHVDRPVTSYDFLFMLTKSANYYYDQYAIGDEDFNLNVKDIWAIGHDYGNSLHHYGTFSKEIPRRCILLSTSAKGVCITCKKPWVRVRERVKLKTTNSHIRLPKTKTIPSKDWLPSCNCSCNDAIPATTLDPFMGTATTNLVAELLRRDSIGIEINPKWITASKQRLSRDGGFLADFTTEIL